MSARPTPHITVSVKKALVEIPKRTFGSSAYPVERLVERPETTDVQTKVILSSANAPSHAFGCH